MGKTCKNVLLFLRLDQKFFLQLIDFVLITKVFSDPVWIRTKDLQLRRLLLYPAELRDHF